MVPCFDKCHCDEQAGCLVWQSIVGGVAMNLNVYFYAPEWTLASGVWREVPGTGKYYLRVRRFAKSNGAHLSTTLMNRWTHAVENLAPIPRDILPGRDYQQDSRIPGPWFSAPAQSYFVLDMEITRADRWADIDKMIATSFEQWGFPEYPFPANPYPLRAPTGSATGVVPSLNNVGNVNPTATPARGFPINGRGCAHSLFHDSFYPFIFDPLAFDLGKTKSRVRVRGAYFLFDADIYASDPQNPPASLGGFFNPRNFRHFVQSEVGWVTIPTPTEPNTATVFMEGTAPPAP